MKKILPFLFVLLMVLTNCAPPTTYDILTLKDIDFSHYVAVGGEYTAGYANDGLYVEGQKNSFPSLIAQQVRYIKDMPFSQPFLETGADFHYSLKSMEMNALCPDVLFKFKLDTTSQKSIYEWSNLSGSGHFHNLGIPYLKVADINNEQLHIPGSPTPNMYFQRLLKDPSVSYLEYLKAEPNPTFFTLELGFNDVFGYVLKGGGINNISPQTDFEENYKALLRILMRNNAKGVLFTIPLITDLPFVNMIGHEWIAESNCQSMPLYVKEDSLGEIKKLKLGDYVLQSNYNKMTYGSNKELGISPQYPLASNWVLDISEVQNVLDATKRFNDFIKQTAAENNLALFDMADFMQNIKNGNVVIDGIKIKDSYIYGGFYSLDGWSLTPRGNAIIANNVIDVINTKYESSIPLLNIEDYEGVRFPQRCNYCQNDLPLIEETHGKNTK